ncbi:efflux RND transporter periplasmic adaptor subunit [Anaeromyxobacter oryzae]|uniref:MexE family multidrug efflux RND transporter periplasmic adaptor subunit n=1 Tax=Anaeromyxobacter oryzae TaxID=2918170 RepID=A0ABM7WPZ8_9BACT|nr:efflux RND transporter periplasmic adaptor subunit [Anaeromyxobacter oryzae]BDG01528.1 MexE family multidrug efflux RND transporter periplasmic adaptor subunit [Anaeromyxobacter oryzae]
MRLRILAVLGSTLLIGACHRGAAPPAPPAPTVQVVAVEKRDVRIYSEWVGSLDGFVNAEIKPQVTGYVRKQVYRDGAFVRKGEVLFLIDPRDYKDAADEARATLDRNIAARAKARLDVQRDRQLFAGQAITRQQLDNDLAAEREATAAVEASRASLHRAQLNRGWTQVTSPIDGIAGIAQVQVGNLVNASSTMTTVSQVEPIKAQFSISEVEYLGSVRGSRWAEPGRSADPPLEVILQDGTVYPHRGTVVAVNRQFSPQTGTIAIQGSFPNPGNVLRPGQYARVRAATEVRKDALLVSQRAINELQGSYQVGVVGPDGKLEVRSVKTAGQVGAMAIVLRGVRAGEKVVVSDLARIRPGMEVRAVPASGGSSAMASPPEPASHESTASASPTGSSSRSR